MRAAAIDRFGDPSELRVRDLDDPRLPPDGLLVRVRSAGVNPVDTKVRQGALENRFPCFFPLIPGWDLAAGRRAASAAARCRSPRPPGRTSLASRAPPARSACAASAPTTSSRTT